jgi:hypothetical protein
MYAIMETKNMSQMKLDAALLHCDMAVWLTPILSPTRAKISRFFFLCLIRRWRIWCMIARLAGKQIANNATNGGMTIDVAAVIGSGEVQNDKANEIAQRT